MNVQGSSAPGTGFKGVLDRLISPGATPAEVWLQLLPAIAANWREVVKGRHTDL